jgi:hypothetical protein
MDVETQGGRPGGQATPVWRRRWVKIVGAGAVFALACVVVEQTVLR